MSIRVVDIILTLSQTFFISSDSWKNCMIQLIDIFINSIQRQEEVDTVYTKFSNFLTADMDHYLKYSDSSTRVRKKFKTYKPYWSEVLNIKWLLNMSKSKKNYTKCNGSRQLKSALRQNYIDCRNIVDKTLHKAVMDFNNKTIEDIETSCTTNPTEFWNFMANLGHRVKKDIPMKVYDNNDTLVSDLVKELDGWQNQFKGLYNKPEPVNESTDNINFYNDILPQKRF